MAATPRTHNKWVRVYGNGIDLSGYARQVGPLAVMHEAPEDSSFNQQVKSALLNQPSLGIGTMNCFLDNTVGGSLEEAIAQHGEVWNLSVAIGGQAEPALGDPIYAGAFPLLDHTMQETSGYITTSMKFGKTASTSPLAYHCPWGVLLHPNGQETGPNVATGVDNGVATTKGGYVVFQLLSSDGTVTLTVDDSADDLTYAALAGATSGLLDASLAPKSALVALSTSLTIRQYTRWQLTLGSATFANFVMSLHRAVN